MPQNRGIAFSSKKKREQLKVKKERKRLITSSENADMKSLVPSICKRDKFSKFMPQAKTSIFLQEVEEINAMPNSSRNSRYNLKFRKDQKPKLSSHYEVISMEPTEELEKNHTYFFPDGLNYPRRPPWKKNMSKVELENSENRSFRLFCEDIDKKFEGEELSLYELNLETWRQLWRVTEMSEILLIIVDARFAVAQFPPYLYNHLVEKENKGVILILNKCDLLSPSLVLAWQDYFTKNFPKLIVVPFSSMERKSLKKATFSMAYESAVKLVEACQKLIDGNVVDLSLWRHKIEDEKGVIDDRKCHIMDIHEMESIQPDIHENFKDGLLTIGTIGHPNVGKSSVINALMGKKVVSVSKTPGHTKHFQTIFLTKNIKLCDCPGLVFPSLCPKDLQVILGSYPIAQVRDPISSIAYIASRIDLVNTLKLHLYQLEAQSEVDFQWTPFYICEAWAKKRGYFTRTKGGRPDVHRAANELLRFTLVGFKDLVLALHPPGYNSELELYKNDPRQNEVKRIQGVHAKPSDLYEPSSQCDKRTQKNDITASLTDDASDGSNLDLSSDDSELDLTSDEENIEYEENLKDLHISFSSEEEAEEDRETNELPAACSNKFTLLNVDE